MTLQQGSLAQSRVSDVMIRVGEQVVHGKAFSKQVITGDKLDNAPFDHAGLTGLNMFAGMRPRKKDAIRTNRK
jgi:hypothetical protein